MSFVHLHVHSEYSLLHSLCRINETVAKAKSFGMSAVAISDFFNMYGVFRFYLQAKEQGIKPIIGVQLELVENINDDSLESGKILLIAKNRNGYINLCKLVTASYLKGFKQIPRIDLDLLRTHADDLFLLTGSMEGYIPKLMSKQNSSKAKYLLEQFQKWFSNSLYLEIQRYQDNAMQDELNQQLIECSKELGIPMVATNSVFYLQPDDAYAQEILLCIQTGRAIFEKNRPLSMIDCPEYYFKTAEEMIELFRDYPEAIENTQKIADQCDVDIEHGSLILPRYDTNSSISAGKQLAQIVSDKKKRVKNFEQKEIDARIDYELSLIEEKGYSDYFLITQDFVNWAKSVDIVVGPGRGSGAGSLIAFILGITDVNPLEYALPFERFLNPDRPSPPDFDIDFADTRRDEVLRYVTERFGRDRVAQIITFGKMEARVAIRDVARALGMSYAQGDRIAKMIPSPKQGFNVTIDIAMKESETFKSAYAEEEQVKQVVDIVRKVEKLPRHASVHAAGVIIGDRELTNYLPLQTDERAGRIITQYDMYCIDLNVVSENKAIGLLKFDFLGLRNLSILEQAIAYVKERRGIVINIYDVPLNDQKTYDLVQQGNTIGVFQLESSGMRRLAIDIVPTKISDITAVVALYRPGPMDLIPLYLEGKKNPSKVKYAHPSLEPILGETYGVLVYQEQVMQIANKIAGYSMGEADNLRRAMGKKKKEVMQKEKKRFIRGCVEYGLTEKTAEDIFGFIEKFAAYGFNKPHSVCYAMIAYWTAYMKANYSVEFMTALLVSSLHGAGGPIQEQKIAQAVEEARKMEIDILPPDINLSQESFSIEGNNIRFGLSAVKNVGSAAIESIMKQRSERLFTGFTDFLYRVELRKVNKKTVENLIKAGAFDAFSTRKTLLHVYPHLIKEVTLKKDNQTAGQFGLFFDDQTDVGKSDSFETIEMEKFDEESNMEKEALGFYIKKNPLAAFRDIIEKKTTKKVADISEKDNKKTIIIGGMLNGMRHVKTKKDNADMSFGQLQDETGSIEVAFFPKVFQKYRSLIQSNKILLLKTKVQIRNGQTSLQVDSAVDLIPYVE